MGSGGVLLQSERHLLILCKELYYAPNHMVVFRGPGAAALPCATSPSSGLPGAAAEQHSHLAPLCAVLLEEITELGTGCSLAGAPAQAFRGHLLNPAV
jgi:hypothetical protein